VGAFDLSFILCYDCPLPLGPVLALNESFW
jgi:hypothetical protein